MKNYIEINLLDEAKINGFDLWSHLLTQIHLALASIKEIENGKEKSPIGISFPEYQMGKKFGILGSKLRLFALDEITLQKLDAQKWLSRLSDYIHISNIREVPQKVNSHAIFSRHQPKVNKERLVRRYSKRHNVSYEEALKHYESMKEKQIGLPFIRLKSLSGGENFCLWIKKTAIDQPNYQKFTTYGLSNYDKKKEDEKKYSTVPEF